MIYVHRAHARAVWITQRAQGVQQRMGIAAAAVGDDEGRGQWEAEAFVENVF